MIRRGDPPGVKIESEKGTEELVLVQGIMAETATGTVKKAGTKKETGKEIVITERTGIGTKERSVAKRG